MNKLRAVVSLCLMALMWSIGVQAADKQTVPDDKPFAEAKIVLQISDMSPAKQTLVLNVAGNLLKHYGPDRVAVEVVAYGPGLRLLLADNVNKGRIKMLADDGVRFSACENTIKKFTTLLGEPPKINPIATVVPGGAVRIFDLVQAGYVLEKP